MRIQNPTAKSLIELVTFIAFVWLAIGIAIVVSVVVGPLAVPAAIILGPLIAAAFYEIRHRRKAAREEG